MPSRTDALIRLNKAHFPVTTLGPGRRIGIWTQGCSVKCRGCISLDTWPSDFSWAIPVSQLLDWSKQISEGRLDGVTITGGEPFDQPEALGSLLDGLRQWRATLPQPFDILCYSGRSLDELRERHDELLNRLDALIPEPYREGEPTERPWRGSANQPLVILSRLAESRYADASGSSNSIARLQVSLDTDRVWFIGIPRRGDMAELTRRCAAAGVSLEKVSWKA
jgi:anaerobic ribonucleoside-triphosphate reductase activating protein